MTHYKKRLCRVLSLSSLLSFIYILIRFRECSKKERQNSYYLRSKEYDMGEEVSSKIMIKLILDLHSCFRYFNHFQHLQSFLIKFKFKIWKIQTTVMSLLIKNLLSLVLVLLIQLNWFLFIELNSLFIFWSFNNIYQRYAN